MLLRTIINATIFYKYKGGTSGQHTDIFKPNTRSVRTSLDVEERHSRTAPFLQGDHGSTFQMWLKQRRAISQSNQSASFHFSRVTDFFGRFFFFFSSN